MPHTQKLLRVFIVDDEPLIASTLTLIVSGWGFDAISFSKPREALLAARSEAPDLLISDITMPVLSGIDLATRVQETCPNCKVILFSGQVLATDFLEGTLKNGHHIEILSKPVHPPELLRRIQSVTKADPPQPSVNGVPGKNFLLRSA